jgi:endonuclease-3
LANNKKIDSIISILRKEFPGEEPKPSKSDPLDVLIATMLSQNTTDKTSFIAFENLKKIGSWEEILASPLWKIKKAIKVCGLSNQKAISIKKLLKIIKNERGKLSLDYIAKMDDNKIFDELLRFDGVGIKTVSCVLAFGLGRDVFPVDTHVHRVMNRLGIVKTKSPDKTYEHAGKIVPEGRKFLLHTLLIKYGRKICRAKNPFCGNCVLYDLCEYKMKQNLPPASPRMRRAEKMLKKPKENNFIILEHV